MPEFSQQKLKNSKSKEADISNSSFALINQKPSKNQILAQQKALGNQAVQQLLNTEVIQAKLKMSSPNDQYEREADRVADEIMNRSENPIQENNIPRTIAHKSLLPSGEPKITAQLENSINLLEGKGQPLPESTRAFFKPHFGDLGHVRVHSNDRSTKVADALEARAFTTENNIVFSSGQYSPGSQEGKKLLAHEITHIVQQQREINYSPILQRKMYGVAGETSEFPIELLPGPYTSEIENILNDFIITDNNSISFHYDQLSSYLWKNVQPWDVPDIIEALPYPYSEKLIKSLFEFIYYKVIGVSGKPSTERNWILKALTENCELLLSEGSYNMSQDQVILIQDLNYLWTKTNPYPLGWLDPGELKDLKESQLRNYITRISDPLTVSILVFDVRSSNPSPNNPKTIIGILFSMLEGLDLSNPKNLVQITTVIAKYYGYETSIKFYEEAKERTSSKLVNIGNNLDILFMEIYETVKANLTDDMKEQLRNNVLMASSLSLVFPPFFSAGVLVGISKDTIENIKMLIDLPSLIEGIYELIKAIASVSGKNVTKKMGKEIGYQIITKINDLAKMNPIEFSYEMGKICGPFILDVLLAITGVSLGAAVVRKLGPILKVLKKIPGIAKLRKVVSKVRMKIPAITGKGKMKKALHINEQIMNMEEDLGETWQKIGELERKIKNAISKDDKEDINRMMKEMNEEVEKLKTQNAAYNSEVNKFNDLYGEKVHKEAEELDFSDIFTEEELSELAKSRRPKRAESFSLSETTSIREIYWETLSTDKNLWDRLNKIDELTEKVAILPSGNEKDKLIKSIRQRTRLLEKDLKAAEIKNTKVREHDDIFEYGEYEGLSEVNLDYLKLNQSEAKQARYIWKYIRERYAKILGVEPGSGGQVHHAIEVQSLKLFPGVLSESDLNHLINMRGIKPELGRKLQLHNSGIRRAWNVHYKRIMQHIKDKNLVPNTTDYDNFVRKELEIARDEIDWRFSIFYTPKTP